MSGGHGFVLDLNPELVNTELVEVEAVSAEDALALRAIVAAHGEYPDSAVARELLADWPAARRRFSAVIPRDFKRVLEATRLARVNGEDVDTAVMAAART